MSQIIKAFMGVFLTLFMAVTAMGILAAYMEVMNAQDMQARIVDEIENSDFNTGVVRQCFLQRGSCDCTVKKERFKIWHSKEGFPNQRAV